MKNYFILFFFLSSMPVLAQKGQPENPYIRTFTVNGVSFSMIPLIGGEFTMGSEASQLNFYFSEDLYSSVNESHVVEKEHQVELSNYYIGQTEVTQALWMAVMGENPSHHTGNDQLPVEKVSWYDCQEFIKKLNAATGTQFRLPTEAEWEYAARGGGNVGMVFAGNDVSSEVANLIQQERYTKARDKEWSNEVGWNKDNSEGQLLSQDGTLIGEVKHRTHPIMTKRPCVIHLGQNQYALIYDMSGNVSEWCQDYYDRNYYSHSPKLNPCNNEWDVFNVLRGGSFSSLYIFTRTAMRNYGQTDRKYTNVGFRLACDWNAKESKLEVRGKVIDLNRIETKNESKSNNENKIMEVVEIPPSFPGGLDALKTFLITNVHYPSESEKNGIQGRVIVSFVVNEDGSISDIALTKGVDPELNNEALRVVHSMPKWQPGMNNGVAVRVKYNLPISFKLPEVEPKEGNNPQ